jgi:hypothetical protein
MCLLHVFLPAAFMRIFPRLLHRFPSFLPAASRVVTGYKKPPPLAIATTTVVIIPSASTKTCLVA